MRVCSLKTVFSPFNLGKSRRTVSLMYDSWEIKPPNFVETVMAITVANFASVSSSRYSGPCNIIAKSIHNHLKLFPQAHIKMENGNVLF